MESIKAGFRAVAVLPLLLIAACGSSGTKAPTAAPPAVESSTAGTPTAQGSPGSSGTPTKSQPKGTTRTAKTAYFQLPSGNIGCHMEPMWVRCDIRDQTYPLPSRPSSCKDGEFGKSMRFDKGKVAKFICTGDTLLPAPETLAYGDTVVVNRNKCFSEQSGVSCYDLDSGNGFALSRTEYRYLAPS